MVRVEKRDGYTELRLDSRDIDTPWNKCPNVFWAQDSLLQNYNFGTSPGKFVRENQPDNNQRSWWQMQHAMGVIRELCKNQDPGYMDEKLTKFERQVEQDMSHPDDRATMMKLTDKDREVFNMFNVVSETKFEPLFDGVEDEPTRTALKVCMDWAKSIGLGSPKVMLEKHHRCKVAVNRVIRESRWK